MGIYGPALVAWLDELRGEQTMRSFAADHGIDDQRISSWKGGSDPQMKQLRNIAEGIGVPLGQVLLAAGLVDESELAVIEAPEPVPPNIDEAIEKDPTLTAPERDVLRSVRRAMRDVAEGRKRSTRQTVTVRRKRKPQGP